MEDEPASGDIFGIPYNFERPSLKRLLSAYWQPGKGMVVETPFGVGYSLNFANWRSWLVVGLVGILLWQERSKGTDEGEEEAVEVVVEE
ncbi:MAG: DUF5808 domain-containing protein [Halodesulfurarchaeum sp.]